MHNWDTPILLPHPLIQKESKGCKSNNTSLREARVQSFKLSVVFFWMLCDQPGRILRDVSAGLAPLTFVPVYLAYPYLVVTSERPPRGVGVFTDEQPVHHLPDHISAYFAFGFGGVMPWTHFLSLNTLLCKVNILIDGCRVTTSKGRRSNQTREAQPGRQACSIFGKVFVLVIKGRGIFALVYGSILHSLSSRGRLTYRPLFILSVDSSDSFRLQGGRCFSGPQRGIWAAERLCERNQIIRDSPHPETVCLPHCVSPAICLFMSISSEEQTALYSTGILFCYVFLYTFITLVLVFSNVSLI